MFEKIFNTNLNLNNTKNIKEFEKKIAIIYAMKCKINHYINSGL